MTARSVYVVCLSTRGRVKKRLRRTLARPRSTSVLKEIKPVEDGVSETRRNQTSRMGLVMKPFADQLQPFLRLVPAVPEKPEEKPEERNVNHCSSCSASGHNSRTCPLKDGPEKLWHRALRLQRPGSLGKKPHAQDRPSTRPR